MTRPPLGAAFVIALVTAFEASAAIRTTAIVAETDNVAPDGNGSFSSFEPPILNDAGQAAFAGSLAGTIGGANDDSGIFRGDGIGGLIQIARTGQAGPVDDGSFLSLGSPALNNLGQVAFYGRLARTAGIFRGDGVDTAVQIARPGQAAPDGNGIISVFGVPIAFNDAGQAVFAGRLTETLGGVDDDGLSSDNIGLFRSDGVDPLVQMVRKGQSVPDANGSFITLGVSHLNLNDAGQIAFRSKLADTVGGSSDDGGIFRVDGVAPPVQIARSRQAAPDGNGRFSSFAIPAINNAGEVAFAASLTGTVGESTDDGGIFRSDGLGDLVQIARGGQPAPDGNGSFVGVGGFNVLALNDGGQVAFVGSLRGTNGGFSDNYGIFLYDDLLGLVTVARGGDEFRGSTITRLAFERVRSRRIERSGLNGLGQIAYGYTLADGRSGVAVTTIVPEPASATLLTLGGWSVLGWRRRWTAA